MRFYDMGNDQIPLFSVSQFTALINQTLEYAYPSVEIEGEVASFKVNQGNFVFFDLKDAKSSLGCFMMLFHLRQPIENGMKVIIRARPKLTAWGKFSLTVEQIRPSGEGSLKKSYELLKAKLEKEGLFALDRKRLLPSQPEHIAVISSTQAAGYGDFIKIIDTRWGGMRIDVAHVQVQGEGAPDQMIRALAYINQQEELPEVIVLVRGGGSADDLAAFNDEPLVRAVAASRVPVLTGIGHEVDESLVDLVADVRASTPSNAAELLVPDRNDIRRHVRQSLRQILSATDMAIDRVQRENTLMLQRAFENIEDLYELQARDLSSRIALLSAYNPRRALQRGYAIVRGETKVGAIIDIETSSTQIKAEVKDVKRK